ncbi:MAG: FecR domain-containing protein [Cyclobacteriaceae bacterium]
MKRPSNDILNRYNDGQVTKPEAKRVIKWLGTSEGQGYYTEMLEHKIKNQPSYVMLNDKGEQFEMLRKVNAKIDNPKSTKKNNNKPYYWVAAAVMFLIVCSFYLLNQDFNASGQDELSHRFITKENTKGQRRMITLPDQSIVWLNAESQLTYSTTFTNERKVYLKGEAFFDVKHDKARPFSVASGDVEVKVLGTSFNVRSFSESELISVAVATGKVQVTGNNSSDQSEDIFLLPDQMCTYSKRDHLFEKIPFDKIDMLGWKEGILKFTDADFKTLKNELERWYGVSIIFENKVVSDRMDKKKDFTVVYHDESLEAVLKGLSFIFDFEFTIDENVVVIV